MTRDEFVSYSRALVASLEESLPQEPAEPGLVPIQFRLIAWIRDFADRAEALG